MDLSMSDQIRVILRKKGLTISKLAGLLRQSQQNLSNKLKRDNFSIGELHQIAEVLDVKFKASFEIE